MITIKTKLGQSKIHGIGLFANEDIPKGKIIWEFNPIIDIYYSKSDLEKLSKESREQLHKYLFLDKTRNKYLLCGDDARFLNHSNKPNCDDSIDDLTISLEDINKGDELTVNYYHFYGDVEEHLKLYKNL